MKKIIVLGAGRVGSAIAIDLAKKHEVTSVDYSAESLASLSDYDITIQQENLAEISDYTALTKGFDMAINAVPGFMGYETLRKIIEAKIDVVDIAFFPEDPFGLNELAKQKGVTAVVDCGVAPGMGNIILGRENEAMKVENYEC